MSDEDKELEQLKEKRLTEMQKNISYRQKKEEEASEKLKKPTLRESLLKNLGYRGLEVLQNAEYQFPQESKIVIEKLGELIQLGEINEELDGGKLLALFRSLGINVHMETKINIEQEGKLVSLSEKLRNKSSSNNTNDNFNDSK